MIIFSSFLTTASKRNVTVCLELTEVLMNIFIRILGFKFDLISIIRSNPRSNLQLHTTPNRQLQFIKRKTTREIPDWLWFINSHPSDKIPYRSAVERIYFYLINCTRSVYIYRNSNGLRSSSKAWKIESLIHVRWFTILNSMIHYLFFFGKI